jgi:hypothetical protein
MKLLKIASTLLLLLVLAPGVWAQDACDDCRKSAVAEMERCRAAAPSASMQWAQCAVKMGEARTKCRQTACMSWTPAKRYTLCDECVRDAEVQERISNNLPAGEKRPCYARAEEMKKPCREICQPAK